MLLTLDATGLDFEVVAFIVCGVIGVDGDDPIIKIGRLYSSCAIVRGPPVV